MLEREHWSTKAVSTTLRCMFMLVYLDPSWYALLLNCGEKNIITFKCCFNAKKVAPGLEV